MKNIVKTTFGSLLACFITVSFLINAAFPAAAIAQENGKSKSANEQSKDKAKKKNEIKKFDDLITENAVSDEGLFTTHKVDDKYYFEIPDSLLEQELLVVSRISGTVQNFNFGGAGMKARGEQVWRFQRKDNQILLRSVSYTNVASMEKPIYQSVRNNNFEPIIMTFKIEAYNKDTSGTIINVGDLFTTDVPMIGPLSSNQRKNFGIRNLDKKRSLIMWTKSFPKNTNVRHVLTFNGSKLPANQNTGTLSIEMNQSIILLPANPMKPRLYDRRVGYFSVRQTDYGRDAQKAERRTYITKWRLEPKDMEAFKRGELVEPVKQIVYYVDPATPVKWRKYLKQEIEDWQPAFEEAGFKNAIIAKDPPSKEEDPDWRPEDVRYSVLRYTANNIQNAMGPHVSDPRTGEILESDIIWYHNVMNLLRNWFLIQTAAVNPDARGVKFNDEIMGKLLRFVAAHEVGHTLGFPHNMGASTTYPVDSLRSPSFTKKMGVSPSIMDYARFNYVAQPGDGADLFPKIGVYDKWVTKWGYTPLPDAKTADEEKPILDKWIKEKAGDRIYWYGRQQFDPIDPRAQTEDIGDDAMRASSFGIKNLQRVLDGLLEWTAADGKNYDDLEELYGQVVGQWNRYSGHVKSNIGGIYETDKTYDQEGDVYEFVPESIEKTAMKWLQENTFSTPKWLIRKDLLSKFEGAGIVERIRSAQTRTLGQLLSAGRIARLIDFEAYAGPKAYSALEMMDDLTSGIWSELKRGKPVDVFRRNLQRGYIERMGMLMKDRPAPSSSRFSSGPRVNVGQSDIRPLVRAQLNSLKGQLSKAIKRAPDSMTKYHYQDAVERINKILDPED